MKRVVVTGIGALGPSGNSFAHSWDSIKAGISGTGLITRFSSSDIPWKFAGELKEFDACEYLSQKERNRLDPFVQYAVTAALMAAEDAGLIKKADHQSPHPPFTKEACLSGRQGQGGITNHALLESAGVIIGSSRGGICAIEKALVGGRANKGGFGTPPLRLSPYLMPSTTIGMAASCVAQTLGLKCHCLGISNACSSGTNAVGEAFRFVKSGYSQLILAGGSESPICRLCVEGYGKSGALSKCGISRPFDKKRDGFVLSEGACILALEEYEHAKGRRARIYGELIGYGNTADAFHMTRPDPGGEARAILSAIKEGGISPDEVDYINTHGTGTQIGDVAEARAIELVFGKRASTIPSTAIKSMTGHMLAASGSFEIASTLMSMREGLIPPTINLAEKDPECKINIVTEKMEADIRIAISNSFGFGGVNAVIAMKLIDR